MQLLKEEEELVYRITQLLEVPRTIKSLNQDEISLNDIQWLLASPNADLSMFGLYVLSLLPEGMDLTKLKENEASARNYVRFLIAEKSVDLTRNIATDESARHPSLLRNFEELSARLIPPFQKTAKAEQRQEMTIIIHGTWAATSDWWQRGGNFWNYVNGITGNVYGGKDAFSWTGANNHKERIKAANDLVRWVGLHPCTNLDIIAHSHGGNVGFFATRLGLKIRKLITLGTPVRLEYLPDLRNIGMLYNLFSATDFVQTPAGTFPNKRGEGRTLSDGMTMINQIVTDDGHGGQPGHSELHEPDIWKANHLENLLK
ncbi:MAG: hypothetical protein E3K36_17110 [Candidatus Brocadia sp.]|nr:hypothetical protein [Candidatus Brocadia sp.]